MLRKAQHVIKGWKANPFIRWSLRKALYRTVSTRSIAHFPLRIRFPANAHFQFFFSNQVDYEPDTMRLFRKYIKSDMVFFDVGSNIGIYTLVGAHLVGPRGKVYSFEPDPQNVTWLERNIALNRLHNVQIHEDAVGETYGELPFFQDTTTSRTSSILEDVWTPDAEQRTQITVQIKPLDHYVDELDRIDVIKIDVENYEYEVLSGAKTLLQKFRPVLFIEMSSRKKDASLQILEELGYHQAPIEGIAQQDLSLFLPEEP